ncbi:hypothetical protein CDV26_03190 [Francisella halioticida]|uniref:Uncharacterized protein n=1 Tax=Francisella halioticida TaxID=549298 RepID=A0ABM6LYH7_9GAMM|nr:hypothetical protein [Francisella halioticida]ASG67530.1 hypothetical protein CDV26_03190 [Francisella halioticida]
MSFPFGNLAYTNSFREELYDSFETYADTTFELIDALSSSNAKTAVVYYPNKLNNIFNYLVPI